MFQIAEYTNKSTLRKDNHEPNHEPKPDLKYDKSLFRYWLSDQNGRPPNLEEEWGIEYSALPQLYFPHTYVAHCI